MNLLGILHSTNSLPLHFLKWVIEWGMFCCLLCLEGEWTLSWGVAYYYYELESIKPRWSLPVLCSSWMLFRKPFLDGFRVLRIGKKPSDKPYSIPYFSRWMAKCTLKIPGFRVPHSDNFFKANRKQGTIFWETAVVSLVVVIAAHKITDPAHTLFC